MISCIANNLHCTHLICTDEFKWLFNGFRLLLQKGFARAGNKYFSRARHLNYSDKTLLRRHFISTKYEIIHINWWLRICWKSPTIKKEKSICFDLFKNIWMRNDIIEKTSRCWGKSWYKHFYRWLFYKVLLTYYDILVPTKLETYNSSTNAEWESCEVRHNSGFPLSS